MLAAVSSGHVTLSLLCVVVAIVLFVVCAFGVNPPRAHLGWLGLAFLALSFVL